MKKFLYTISIFIILALVLSGCANTGEESSAGSVDVETLSGETNYPVDIEDTDGTVEITSEPTRIVSLSPSNTETLFALGAQDRVVGRTDYDNYPPEASSIESIGSYSDPSTEQILAKSPDLVVTNALKDDIKKQLEAAGVKVLIFNPISVQEVEEYIVTLGEAINENDNATKVIEDMNTKLSEILEKTSSVTEEKTVFLDIGDFYSAGPDSLLNNELDLIGAENIAADSDTAYPQLSAETIIADNPDVYISFTQTLEQLKSVPGFDTITAFKDNQVYCYAADSTESDVVKRPGPRIVDGVELLAKDIYPDAFK